MKNEEKKPKAVIAYTMVPGDNFMQYKVLAFRLVDGKVVGQEQIGSSDLKPIVLGRVVRLLTHV